MIGHFGPGIDIPLHPFFGSMGDAPPPSAGRYDSAPPWMHAGNIDNKEMVAGTTLFIPVHVKGALLKQATGTPARATERWTSRRWRRSSPGRSALSCTRISICCGRARRRQPATSAWISSDLKTATEMAVRNMIDFLVTEKHLSRDDAYMLISVAADVDITQLVDQRGHARDVPESNF